MRLFRLLCCVLALAVMAAVPTSFAQTGNQQNAPAPTAGQLVVGVGHVNVGDLAISAPTCTGVVPGGSSPTFTVSFVSLGGFNAPLTWDWEGPNSHAPVGTTPVTFSGVGNATLSPPYGPLSFTLTNSQAQDGLVLYFFHIQIRNTNAVADEYFPVYFDLSLSQNFCGAAGAARGGFTRINGSWSRSAVGGGAISLGRRPATGAAGGSVDLHVSAADVSFTPSLPKFGDTVQVRFRVRNDGTANAKGVPIALQVNGVTVASDTFDVGAGRTALGGLQWNSASVPLSVGTRPAA